MTPWLMRCRRGPRGPVACPGQAAHRLRRGSAAPESTPRRAGGAFGAAARVRWWNAHDVAGREPGGPDPRDAGSRRTSPLRTIRYTWLFGTPLSTGAGNCRRAARLPRHRPQSGWQHPCLNHSFAIILHCSTSRPRTDRRRHRRWQPPTRKGVRPSLGWTFVPPSGAKWPAIEHRGRRLNPFTVRALRPGKVRMLKKSAVSAPAWPVRSGVLRGDQRRFLLPAVPVLRGTRARRRRPPVLDRYDVMTTTAVSRSDRPGSADAAPCALQRAPWPFSFAGSHGCRHARLVRVRRPIAPRRRVARRPLRPTQARPDPRREDAMKRMLFNATQRRSFGWRSSTARS